jgi:hypothetical protein
MGFDIGLGSTVFDPLSKITENGPEDDVTTWVVQFRELLSAADIER